MATTRDEPSRLEDITEEELNKFVAAFYQENVGEGELSLEQVRSLANAVAPRAISDSRLKSIHAEVSRSDPFDYPRLLQLLSEALNVPSSKDDLLVSFSSFDKDRDGHLTKDELRSLLKTHAKGISSGDIEDIISACDPQGSGRINIQSVVKMMKG
eukprot:m.11068 g.11068  ORF g.11068 m.11068 type:complete len:156 (+) comp4368_c0_seq1:142-609(+)